MKNTLSVKQQSIITGSLLGDGSIDKPRYGNSAFVKSQCVAHLDYLKWHSEQFGSMSCLIKTYPNVAKGKVYYKSVFRVKTHPFFSHLRQEWYPGGKKIIPRNIILDPLAVAIWYFDDGSNVVSARQISLATYCFPKGDVQFLSDEMFKHFGIECSVNNKNVLTVHAESYKTMVDLVRPYMLWDCFKHKLAYRDSLAAPSCKKDIDKVVALYKKGSSVSSIASQLGVSEASVYNQLKRERVGGHIMGLVLNNSSGIKGVCFDRNSRCRKKWIAQKTINGKNVRIGRFDTKEEAGAAIQTAPATPA